MPVIEHYEENPQILKDCNQIDIDISKECFTCGKLIAQGEDFQIWCANTTLNQQEENERKVYIDDNEAFLVYYMVSGNDLFDNKHFYKNGKLKPKYIIGFIQVQRKCLRIQNKYLDRINKRYIVERFGSKHLRVSEVIFSYIAEEFRGKGLGRFLYRWTMYSEKILMCGYCLHTSKFKISGSLAIWKRWLLEKYNPVVWNTTNRSFTSFKSNLRMAWKTRTKCFLVSCGKIIKGI